MNMRVSEESRAGRMEEYMSEYISNQIAVYKNSKVLVEFRDKLKVASIANYAHLHADGEETDSDYKRTSLIGILLKDYSKGTGDMAVTAQVNISPDEARFLFSRLKAGFPAIEFRQDKIFGQPDAKGYSTATKLVISRALKEKNGADRKIPWRIEVDNGKGIAVRNSNGGTYMKANSYVSSAKASASLGDLDMFRLLGRTDAYIDAWEKAVGPSLITQAKKAIQKNQEAQQSAA